MKNLNKNNNNINTNTKNDVIETIIMIYTTLRTNSIQYFHI